MNTGTRPQILLLDTIAEAGVGLIREFADVSDGRGLAPGELFDRIAGYDGIVIKSGNHITRAFLERARRLRIIGRAGSGLDNIDLEAARDHGVTVVASPEGNVGSVAEYVVAVALLLTHRLPEAHTAAFSNDFRRARWQGRNLAGLTVGVVGAGHIGRGVVEKIAPLCGRVVVFSPGLLRDAPRPSCPGFDIADSLPALLQQSDVVTLHLPLTRTTRGLLDKAAFAHMRPGTILINSARGGVIDEAALLDAFERGIVQAAALDVLDPDPTFNVPPTLTTFSHHLIHHPKVFYTPHIAAGSEDALREVATSLAAKMAAFFRAERALVTLTA